MQNRFYLIFEQIVFRLLDGVADYGENEKQDDNKKMKDDRK